MKYFVLFFVFILGSVNSKLNKEQTPLDIYVNTPDPSYKWKLIESSKQEGYIVYFINLTSQTWLSEKESDRSVWTHWLSLCIPDKVLYSTAMIYIDGGENSDHPPKSMDSIIQPLCGKTGTIIAEIDQIPNEPIRFTGNGAKRVEDAIIAYTWSHFINQSSEPFWLLRLPMTKAVVRAMDSVEEFVKTQNGIMPITQWVVSGASKRGWTTWTTAAVDPRVIAFVPIVIPVLNIVPNIGHQWRAYGDWSFALDDYLDMGIMRHLNEPIFKELAAVVDPYSYLSRFKMPKYLICSTGDEFFLPDSLQFFYGDLIGEKNLRLVPNAEHSLIGHQADVIVSIATFYYLILNNIPRPEFTWNLVKSNTTASITVKLLDKQVPYIVKVWQASTLSFVQRDFRLVVCDDIKNCLNPVFWYETIITGNNGTYSVSIDAPKNGWIGFMIELEYKYGPNGEWPLVFTTEVNIVPDRLPFLPCGDNCQPN